MMDHKIKLCNLSYSNVFYKTLFDICADSMVAISVEVGKVIDFNENAFKALGYTRDEFLRLDLMDYDMCETQTEMMAHVERIVKKGEETYFTKHRTKEGKVLDIEVRAKFVEINKDKFIFCIWRDVTDIRRTIHEKEELIARLRSNLDELEKLRRIVNLCPGCRRICGENGRWEPLENFLPDTSVLGHGTVCPDCRKKAVKPKS